MPGTYVYTIKETGGSEAGMTYDTAEKAVTVVMDYNAAGTALEATSITWGSAAVTAAKPVTVTNTTEGWPPPQKGRLIPGMWMLWDHTRRPVCPPGQVRDSSAFCLDGNFGPPCSPTSFLRQNLGRLLPGTL